jgi:transcriptional regulator with XRE-family HTH domain
MITKKLKGYSASKLQKEILDGPITFGMAVEALRTRDQLSQTDFAKKLGVSRQYLCDVEKGRRLVSPEQAAKFAKAFGHPPAVLVKLALQDAVDSSGLKLRVSIDAA